MQDNYFEVARAKRFDLEDYHQYFIQIVCDTDFDKLKKSPPFYQSY